MVYNSGGSDSAETLKQIEGVFDIFLPDFKFADAETGRKLSGVPGYPQRAEEALREMFRQAGPVTLSRRGAAHRGVIVRHLVLPEDLAASYRVIDSISVISPSISVNIMDQYHPEYRAKEVSALKRRPAYREIEKLCSYASSRVTLIRR